MRDVYIVAITCNVGNRVLRLWFRYFGLLVDVQFVKVLSKPHCNWSTSLPDVFCGQQCVPLKNERVCSACNRYFVLVFRQVSCTISVFLFILNYKCYIQFIRLAQSVTSHYICAFYFGF